MNAFEPETQHDASDDLVTVATGANEFEAGTLAAVLREQGIETHVFGAVHSSLAFNAKFTRVPVQVRRRDLERARLALEQNIADSVDIDWDEVDVGERVDRVPLKRVPGSMPLLPRLGFLAAVLLVIVFVLALAITAVLSLF